ncbi:MAG: helix-turn-helix transcriptional regulator [Firmicutes bacterium]|nr:helix-turn-helix transcriptional regulator [Bacillota bacterium]
MRMDRNINQELKNYLSHLQVNLIVAAYTHCPVNWRDIDYIPDYNKFYFICNGEGWLKIGEQEFYPKPGQLFFMPAGVKQSYSTISNNTFVKYWCHFTAKIGDVNLYNFIRVPFFIDVINKKEVEKLFLKLIEFYERGEIASYLYAQSVLIEIFAYYIENIPKENLCFSPSLPIEKLNHVLRYIENNISCDLTIEQLAKMASFHPNYFIRFFKKHMGNSPINYINRIRMEKAKDLLIIKDMNITEIAYAIGFNDVYHFSKAFKKYTGFSPTEFRNIVKKTK